MRKPSAIISSAAGLGMLMLILDGRTALAGMQDGVTLCLRVLIPSLFPFIFLSTVLVGAISGASFPVLRPLGRLLSIPEGCEHLLIIGALGGYPVGAKEVANAYQNGQMDRADAQRMLAFCSNAGPSFIFGMLAPLFSDPRLPWLLWAVHLESALLVGWSLPGRETASQCHANPKSLPFTQALEQTLQVMASVCGWVVLFRLFLAFLDRWIFGALPDTLNVLCSGLLELSNGCVALSRIPDESLRFLLAAAMLAFGGCCVGLQTHSVCGSLPCSSYFLGKGMQLYYTLILVSGVLVHPALWLLALVLPPLIRRLLKKRSSNFAAAGV